MKISSTATPLCPTSFKSTISEQCPTGEITVRQLLRDSVEKDLNGTAFYLGEIGRLPESRVEQMLQYYKTVHLSSSRVNKTEDKNAPKYEKCVDAYKLQSSIRGVWERNENKLYTGPYFIANNEIPKIKILKECGIETVLALCHYDPYGEDCKEAGLNYIGLSQIGNKSLHPFIIKRDRQGGSDLISDLINNKNIWVDGHSDKKTSDLKEFVKILNGENENYPYPIYYGCTQGTNMTSCWNDLYNILKNEDTKKPLSDEVIIKLAELRIEIDDTYRD